MHLDIVMFRCNPDTVRTTLNIDDDLMAAARTLARHSDRTLSEVVSDLLRRGLAPRQEKERTAPSGFPTFDVPSEASPITLEMVQRALEDLE